MRPRMWADKTREYGEVKLTKIALKNQATAFDTVTPRHFLARLNIKAIAIRPVSGLVIVRLINTCDLRLPRYCFNKTIVQWHYVNLRSLTVAGAA
jgi:hypothetical protein